MVPRRHADAEIRFVHVLYQNVLYGSCSRLAAGARRPSWRRCLALRLGGTLSRDALPCSTKGRRATRSSAKYFSFPRSAPPRFRVPRGPVARRAASTGCRARRGARSRATELGLQMIRCLALRSVKAGRAGARVDIYTPRARALCQHLAIRRAVPGALESHLLHATAANLALCSSRPRLDAHASNRTSCVPDGVNHLGG